MRKIFGIGFFVMLVSPDLTQAQLPVGDALSRAQTIDGHYISWKEHLIDGLELTGCLLYTSPSPRDQRGSRMPSSA